MIMVAAILLAAGLALISRARSINRFDAMEDGTILFVALEYVSGWALTLIGGGMLLIVAISHGSLA